MYSKCSWRHEVCMQKEYTYLYRRIYICTNFIKIKYLHRFSSENAWGFANCLILHSIIQCFKISKHQNVSKSVLGQCSLIFKPWTFNNVIYKKTKQQNQINSMQVKAMPYFPSLVPNISEKNGLTAWKVDWFLQSGAL